MRKTVSFGSTGVDVQLVQAKLNSLLPDFPIPLVCDGAFGAKTLGRVKALQGRSRLVADGVVGPRTWAILIGTVNPALKFRRFCHCQEAQAATPGLMLQLRDLLSEQKTVSPMRASAAGTVFNAPSNKAGFLEELGRGLLPGGGAVKLPTLRRLTSAEKTKIDAVYGSSINHATVFLSDITGSNNRAFVVAASLPGLGKVQVVNIGTSFTDHTLVHEFGHVWQSQHHSSPTQYMVNAIASQALEALSNDAIGADVFSAYAYVPGRPFSEYGAEQMAQAAANGDKDVVKHVQSIPMNAIDPSLLLLIPRVEDWTQPGVQK